MKILVLFISLLATTTILSASEIEFIKNDFEKAFEEAKKQDKIIFVDAYATWCGPCKYMEANVFTDDSVAVFYNEHFVSVKIDVESTVGLQFQKKYPVSAMPTFYFIDKDGKVLKKKVGGLDASRFLKLAFDVLNPENSKITKLTKRYENGERSKEFLFEYIQAMMAEELDILHLCEEYFSDLEDTDLDSLQAFAVFTGYNVGLESKFSKYFLNNFDSFQMFYGEYAQNKLFDIINFELLLAIEGKDISLLDPLYGYLKPIYKTEDEFQRVKGIIDKEFSKATLK